MNSMIELRWIRRDVLAPEYGEGVLRQVRVLQYRHYDHDGWHDNWQDVPEGRDDD